MWLRLCVFKQGLFLGPHLHSIQPNQAGQVWTHPDTPNCRSVWPHGHFPETSTSRRYVLNSQELPRVSVMIYYWMVNCQIAGRRIDAARALREWTLYSELSLPVLKGTQKEQRWQHVDYNDLTCHVAVYLCGPQGTTPIRINGVEARGAANQLVGLTRRLVDGWKKQSGGLKSVIPRRIHPRSGSFLLPVSSDNTASLFMNY